jgi:hypothetical protein
MNPAFDNVQFTLNTAPINIEHGNAFLGTVTADHADFCK